MITLDDLLSQRAQILFDNKLGDALDITSWTAENRDEKLNDVLTVSEGVADESVKLIRELIDVEVNGKPLLYWKTLEQFLIARIDFLDTILGRLNASSEEELATYPVTYEWVIGNIRAYAQELKGVIALTEEALNPTEVVEEL